MMTDDTPRAELIRRGPKHTDERKIPASTSLPPRLYDLLVKEARQNRRPLADEIRRQLEQRLPAK